MTQYNQTIYNNYSLITINANGEGFDWKFLLVILLFIAFLILEIWKYGFTRGIQKMLTFLL